MSTFYLLPSRPVIGARFAGYLNTLFPGLDWPSRSWSELAEALGAVAGNEPDVYVIYQDDLPEAEDTVTALSDGFGAAAGDDVIEIVADEKSRELRARRWRIGAAA